ncbi:hypothetical protein [Sporosarcina sp. Marseille-Q4943]|uniref:hypothetical protein n=1 Tax=Sporosarcina sp. Marseille-Q4943 TaxID=2942204 RepID=UPI00208DC12E|nr:hypothetical protein [Sporosarcina sp. Marseille-Q4943]
MTNNQWDDNKLENLLHSMPKIEDNRTKEQILDRLKQDQRLKKRRRINPRKWMPVIVAAAALLLLGLIVPSMLNSHDGAMEKSGAPRSLQEDRAFDAKTEKTEEAETFDASATKESTAIIFAAVDSHVLLADEVVDYIPLQVGLVESANVIPITFLIPDSRVQADFPAGNPTSVELYNKYAEEIPEEELGFEDYHPYKGTLYEENGILRHQIPAEHKYDLSSAANEVYYNSMRDTFSEFEKLLLVDEKGNQTSFESIGKSDAEEWKKTFPYYKYTMPSGKVYLAPYAPAAAVDTVDAGLMEMKNVNGNIVASLIPENVDYDVSLEDDIAVITFKEQLDVNAFEQNVINQMIEGFMLTARSYGKQVRLENVVQESFDNYDLSTALPMPIGSNPTLFTQ